MSSPKQQATAPPQSITSSSLTHQQQNGKKSNQPNSSVLNQHKHLYFIQKDSSEKIIQHCSQIQMLNAQQQQLQTFSPQISPPQNIQYNPNQPQTQNPGPVLLQVPPQPLFQQQSGQQSVIISPQQQLLMQQQFVHSQQLNQPYQQQLQQQQQQPMAILQTPILYSSAHTSNSPPKGAVKTKGRFRVVKSAPNDTKASIASAGDSSSCAPPHDVQSGPEKTSQPITTLRKGRFVVKKGSVTVSNASSKCNGASKAGNKVTVPNENDSKRTCRDLPSDQSIQSGVSAKVSESQHDNTLAVQPDSVKLAEAKKSCTKKKGRFTVKTGGISDPCLPAADTKTLPASSSGVANAIHDSNGAKKIVDEKDDRLEHSASKLGDAPRRNSSSMNGADTAAAPPVVLMKKKGRFVVKTGGSAGSSPAGTNAKAGAVVAIDASVNMPRTEEKQIAAVGSSRTVQLTSAVQPTYEGCQNIPIPLVDPNGQMMAVQQIAGRCQPQVLLPPIQSTVSLGGFQPQHSQQTTNPPDSHPPLPPGSRPHAMTDERHEQLSSTGKKTAPRQNRPAGGSSSSWAVGGRALPPAGKNGCLIGTGGFGKVLHYLDTLRLEVVEADRSVSSLQSDYRFLRDKNKELEAKVKDLERQLGEEKSLRNAAETKYRSLQKTSLDQEKGPNKLDPDPSVDVHSKTCKVLQKPASQLVNEATSEQRLEYSGSTSFESVTANSTTSATVPKTIDSRITSTSQNNSFDASDPTFTHAVVGINTTLPHSTACLSSIAKQFDPLGTAPHSSVAMAQTTCISTLANINDENVAIPLIVTTAPTPPPASDVGTTNTKCTPNISNKTKHFDPLGTPERDLSGAVPVCVLNGVPQMPAMSAHFNSGGVATVPVIVPLIHSQQQQGSQLEDPFDEIVRMSHSHGTV